MVCLLNEENDERDFFTNIVHIQIHRCIVAMKLLSEKAAAGLLSPSTLKFYLLPMVSNILLNADVCLSVIIVDEYFAAPERLGDECLN